jgi:hypothetical protein
MAPLLLNLVRRARSAAAKVGPPIFIVNAGPEEECDIAAAEADGRIGLETIIIRRFGHLTVDELASLP